jgi:hypothetical protein
MLNRREWVPIYRSNGTDRRFLANFRFAENLLGMQQRHNGFAQGPTGASTD